MWKYKQTKIEIGERKGDIKEDKLLVKDQESTEKKEERK